MRSPPARPARVGGLVIAVLLVGIAARLPLWLTYAPLYSNDTASYEQLAHMIRTGDFTGYDGMRTPGYPLFMLACGVGPKAMWWAQTLMGLGAAVLTISLVGALAGPGPASLCAGLSVALAMNLHFFEAALQTETLALFVIAASAWAFQRIILGETGGVWACLGLGVLAAFAAMVRPLYVFLAPLAALLLVYFRWHDRAGRSSLGGRLAALLLPPAAAVTALCVFNLLTIGYFGMTTHLGFHLLNHTIEFIEKGSPEYADIAATCVREREAHRAELKLSDDNRAFTRVYAERAIRAKTGLDTVGMSRLLTEVSLDAIRHAPLSYASSVGQAWLRFWRFPLEYYPELFRNVRVERAYRTLWWPTKLYWLGLYLVFLILGPWVFLSSRADRPQRFFVLFLWLAVMCSSFLQALMEYSDNSRYSIPTIPLVAVVVFAGLSILRRREKRSPS